MRHPPLCRYCGGPIRKQTHLHWFGRTEENGSSDFWTNHIEKPRSKAEAQRLVNGEVVSVSWYRDNPDPAEHYIGKATTWDRESYVDKWFCNGDHARCFAYVFARAGYRTVKAAEADEVRKITEVQIWPPAPSS